MVVYVAGGVSIEVVGVAGQGSGGLRWESTHEGSGSEAIDGLDDHRQGRKDWLHIALQLTHAHKKCKEGLRRGAGMGEETVTAVKHTVRSRNALCPSQYF